MRPNQKYISSLDLKYLNSKFITIPQGNIDICTSFHENKKSRLFKLPSILSSVHKNTSFLEQQLKESTQNIANLTNRKEDYDIKTQKPNQKVYDVRQSELLANYKNAIKKMKSEDQILHSEIIKIYRDKSQYNTEQKTKHVRNITLLNRHEAEKEKKCLKNEQKIYNKIYENLYIDEQNPYRKKSRQIQQKYLSTNIYKNFQNYLANHNKRIPDFLRGLR